MRLAFRIIILLNILFLASCQKEVDSPDTPDFDNSFYPLVVGSWISYQVEYINIDNEIGVNDTNLYQLKELIESVGEQSKNYINYRVERYVRNNNDDDWVLNDVWQIRQYSRRIHKVEENIEYYKLITPVKLGEQWDGNAFNTSDEQIYEITELNDTSFLDNSLKKVKVIQTDKSSLIDKVYAAEEYIEGFGLVKKTNINVELNINPDPNWQDKVTKGTIYIQSFLSSSESTPQ